jgi:hypothetical protein
MFHDRLPTLFFSITQTEKNMFPIFLFFLVGFTALCGPSPPYVLNIRMIIIISIIISLFVVAAAVLRYPFIIQY